MASYSLESALINNKQRNLKLNKPKVVLLLGKPRRGKTHALKHLILSQVKHSSNPFQYGVVFTGSDFSDEYSWIKPEFVCSDYSDDKLQIWLQQLKDKHPKIPHTFIVFDDLVGLINQSRGYWTNFVCNHRHYNVTIFITAQYLMRGVSPTFRECVNFAILFNSKTYITLKAIHESFGQLFESFKEFKAHFLRITVPKFQAMLYDQDKEFLQGNYVSYKAPKKIPRVMLRF